MRGTNIGLMSVSPSEKRQVCNGEELLTFEVAIDQRLKAHLLEHKEFFDPDDEIGLHGVLACWIAQSIHSSSCGQDTITVMAEIPPKKIRRIK